MNLTAKIVKIENESQLRELYGFPKERPIKKVMHSLDEHAKRFIAKSPFLVLGTFAQNGQMDVSPRGGQPGFVQVVSGRIVIPDSKGNNRLDSLINIVETGRTGTLFFIPGMDETLRANGSASISTDAAYLQHFAAERIPVKSCIVIEPEEVFLHCAKALMRSKLWAEESKIERGVLPSMGQMLKDQIGSVEAPESQEDMVKRYMKDL